MVCTRIRVILPAGLLARVRHSLCCTTSDLSELMVCRSYFRCYCNVYVYVIYLLMTICIPQNWERGAAQGVLHTGLYPVPAQQCPPSSFVVCAKSCSKLYWIISPSVLLYFQCKLSLPTGPKANLGFLHRPRTFQLSGGLTEKAYFLISMAKVVSVRLLVRTNRYWH